MLNYLILYLVIILRYVYSQQILEITCTVEPSGSPGVCKLLSQCQKVIDEVLELQRLPQTCGFQGTQPVVCCPDNKKKIRIPGRISQEKCREYSSFAFLKNAKEECRHKNVKRIIGLDVALRGEFPHMAFIGFEQVSGIIKWKCGGSIVSKQYILTAAHCIGHNLNALKYVQVGITNVNEISHRQILKVLETIVHPDFKTGKLYNDVGLLKLEKPIEINMFARPACLYSKIQIPVEEAIAVGWRTTDSGTASQNLRKETLTIVNYDYCNSTYANFTSSSLSNILSNSLSNSLSNGIIDEQQICTGDPVGLKIRDTCSDGSGGPLQIYHRGDEISCMYDVIGVNSFGTRFCEGKGTLSPRVSYYIKWIEDIVWPQEL